MRESRLISIGVFKFRIYTTWSCWNCWKLHFLVYTFSCRFGRLTPEKQLAKIVSAFLSIMQFVTLTEHAKCWLLYSTVNLMQKANQSPSFAGALFENQN